VHIVFLLRYWPTFGGGETVTRILANKFAERGYDVSILYFWEKKRDDLPFIDSRIKQFLISGLKSPDALHTIYKPDYKILENYLRNFLADNKADVIINQWWPAKLVYKEKKDRPIMVICCHHTNIYQNITINTIKQKIYYRILGSKGIRLRLKTRLHDVFKYSDRLVLLSKYFVDECKLIFNPHKIDKKVRVVNNPLIYNTFVSRENINEKEKEILFVGRISEQQKRITYIIRIWKGLQDLNKTAEWKLVIVGDGADLQKIKDYTVRLKCGNVFFEGQQNPLPYYRRASIFVMTSVNEGWGMTLLEAQQNGCVPVVMDSYSSLHEIITNNINGLIANNNDIGDFISKLILLMENDDLRISLACAGLESCKRFSADRIIQDWESLFSEMLR
jgi:glycosyltransferase involved in cell wall biosynthesis